MIVFATGPLTGSGVPLGARHQVVSKSPMNDTLCSSDSGAFFGHEMKISGFDAVVISGKAKKPVYLWLNHGEAALEDASPYWGSTVNETTQAIPKDLGDPRVRIACIGPAGEKMSRMACIMSDQFRAAGRGDSGRSSGQKTSRQSPYRGTGKINAAEPDKLKEVIISVQKKLHEGPVTSQGLTNYGTQVPMNPINQSHILPTRNHQSAYFENAENISGEKMTETILVRKKPCYSCFVACGRGTKSDGVEGEGPQ